MRGVATRIPVTESSRIPEARRVALKLARRLGFDETKSGKLAIVVTEAATNLLNHAGQGEIVLRMIEDRGTGGGLQILVLDKGPGIADLGEALRDGHSTSGTAGTGLGAMSRLSDTFDVYSQPGKGTAILLQFRENQGVVPPLFEIDGLSIPVEGEELCGDGWSHCAIPAGIAVIVADGLGHGPLAETAASEAIRAFEENPALPPAGMLEVVHRAIRSTRGAAVAIAQIDPPNQVLRFAGIGNIAGAVLAGGESRHLVSMAGIIGHDVRSFREFSYPWPDQAILILHSDGLGTRWDLAAYPGLTRKPCGLMAGVLYRDMARGRDDATAVVVRQANGNS